MSALEEIQIEVTVGRLAALRSGGEGQAKVLALHGWLDNAASFIPLSAHLSGLDLVILDLPGHGRSAHLPPGCDYNLSVEMNAILDVADALGWPQFALLGHSRGAGIASILAAAAPQRVTRLLAIEALGALSELPERSLTRLRSGMEKMRTLPDKKLRIFSDLGTPIRARMQANQLSEPAAHLLVERGVEKVEGGYRWSSAPRLTLPTLQRMTQAQIENVVAGIECPTRVIFAEPAQVFFPAALRDRLVSLLPNGEQVLLYGTHHLHMEDPQAVAAAIGDFLIRD